MRTLRLSTTLFRRFLDSPKTNKISILILVLGLAFFVSWLANYSWTIISTPYPAEYREGAILLLTDFLIHGLNPFSLANHPLMTNNYGFLYNLVVLPFAMIFGNTLAVHRMISILFIFTSCMLIVLVLIKVGTTLPFACAGGVIVMASLLFQVTPLARPDSLGEFFFLLSILLPWQRKFDTPALIASGLTGLLAFLAKPYFILSIGIVTMYVFLFVSKKKGLFYALFAITAFLLGFYIVNIYFECYFLDVLLNNIANSGLSDSHMLKQLTLFVKLFLPCTLILFLAASENATQLFSKPTGLFRNLESLNITRLDQPLVHSPINYFVFLLECTLIVVVVLLGRHLGAYMVYFFQLVTPALILVIFQQKDVLNKKAVMTVPLILINFSLICFWMLYPNQLSTAQQKEWEKLYRPIASSTHILNSPVLVPEMVRLGIVPVDSGQTEYYFNTRPYHSTPFAPEYHKVKQQGMKYLNTIRTKIQNRNYDYIIVTSGLDPNYRSVFFISEQAVSPLASHMLIDQFYNQVELIKIAMPQTGEYWIVEVLEPTKK